ncbi:response regulator [Roseivirga sp.]|uniref:hybrid sensor histidine kinase/response regulator transcription factor n=1 Tax=Roseivirga sp. TaxID=1964215 RepID=UPI003B8C188A
MRFRIIFICFYLLLLVQLSYSFQLDYFYPERKTEVLQKGDSILQLKERQRSKSLNIKGHGEMSIDRLLAEYYLHKAGNSIDSSLPDSAIAFAEKAVRLSEVLRDDELKLVALVTASKVELGLANYDRAIEYMERTKNLKAPRHQQVYRLWTLRVIERQAVNVKNEYRFDLLKYLDIFRLVQDMETDAERLWAVYAAKSVATKYNSLEKYDSAKLWFNKAFLAAEGLPAKELGAQKSLGLAFSGFLLATADYDDALRILTNLDELYRSTNDNLLNIYFKRWYQLQRSAPDEFLRKNSHLMKYSVDQTISYFRIDSSNMRLNDRLRGYSLIIEQETSRENWELVAKLYEELRVFESQTQVEELQKSFNKRNELLQTSAQAQEELRLTELQKSKANQRFYAAGILLVVGISFVVYRNGLLRKKQNAVLNEKNLLIERQKGDLEQLNELKSKFFTNISHELRTPLTLAMGNIKNVSNGKYGALNDRQSKSLAIAGANSKRILGLVNDMLDLSKIESGKEQLLVKSVDLENEVHAVLNLFDVQIEEKALKVEVKALEHAQPIYVDSLKLETILFNLISNAVKHCFTKSTLHIEIQEEAQHQKLSICNAGNGIPEHELPFVFDRFYQAGSVNSGEGSGVGLSLTKELVDLHKAEISVASVLQDSTCFTVSFLKGKDHFIADQVIPESESETEMISVREGATILLVEDNADMRHYLYEMLSDRFKVSLAENGQDALNKIEQVDPDLIITDYMMPQMNGAQFYKALRQIQGFVDTPVVFLTARAIERDREALLKEGVADYILKPFNDLDLMARIGQLLSLKQERAKHSLPSKPTSGEIENKLMNLLRSTVYASLQDAELKPTTLAEALSVSERTLYRKVKAATGFSPQAYIKEVRLQEARRLIENKEYQSISDVAYAVGFDHLSHFSNSYKERFGMSASQGKERSV